MIRLSRMADYAVVLMTHIAARGGVHNAVEAAAATGVPGPTAAKVLKTLSNDGLLTARRGAHGGYELARPAAAINVAQVVSAIDGPIALTYCVTPGAGTCEVEPACPSRSGLNRINTAIRTALEAVSLAELVPQPSRALRALEAEMRTQP